MSFRESNNRICRADWADPLFTAVTSFIRRSRPRPRFILAWLHTAWIKPQLDVCLLLWWFPKMVGFPPKSSIWIGFSIILYINHPFWGTPIFWKHPYWPYKTVFFCFKSHFFVSRQPFSSTPGLGKDVQDAISNGDLSSFMDAWQTSSWQKSVSWDFFLVPFFFWNYIAAERGVKTWIWKWWNEKLFMMFICLSKGQLVLIWCLNGVFWMPMNLSSCVEVKVDIECWWCCQW